MQNDLDLVGVFVWKKGNKWTFIQGDTHHLHTFSFERVLNIVKCFWTLIEKMF